MIYPYGRKGLVKGLEREILRRKHAHEAPIEYFAPVYVEAREVNNRIVSTEKQLLFNYVFVRASENELFRMKKYEEQYNFPHRVSTGDGETFYPYVSDEVMRNLRWIARSYSGVIPVYTGASPWLVKGDRVRITKGRFKGIEASVFENRRNKTHELMLVVDRWMSVPLLRVKAGEYQPIGISEDESSSDTSNICIDGSLLMELHSSLCRFHRGETTAEDISLAQSLISRYSEMVSTSNVMRCKLYALLLPAYVILNDQEKLAGLTGIMELLLCTLKAEQSKALLLVTLYGCTDSSIHHEAAHSITSPWLREDSPKKSKRELLQRLADYDQCFGH